MSAESAGRSVNVLLLFWLVGACLRITVLAVPPVVPLLHSDLHLTETGIGWLSSLPPMLFAVAAVPGALLISRFGFPSSAPTIRMAWARLGQKADC